MTLLCKIVNHRFFCEERMASNLIAMALLASSAVLFSSVSRTTHVPISKTLGYNTPRCSHEQLEQVFPRRAALGYAVALAAVSLARESRAAENERRAKFYELEGSSGVKALDIRQGTGVSPEDGDKVEVHYYGRLFAKQGWRFDSTYDHKDFFGNPEPYVFTVGDMDIIGGMNSAVRSMKEGGVRRVVIPPSQGYQNTSQGPIPPDYFDRQRLYTTIFNQTRLANGEGDTLGTLIFDIELLKVRKPQPQ